MAVIFQEMACRLTRYYSQKVNPMAVGCYSFLLVASNEYFGKDSGKKMLFFSSRFVGLFALSRVILFCLIVNHTDTNNY